LSIILIAWWVIARLFVAKYNESRSFKEAIEKLKENVRRKS
jgi:hypothetical protein